MNTLSIDLLSALPLGTSDFAALRESQQIYVDKTDLIYQLAATRRKYFFARPRRFGKSLLVSTFESLFKYGLRDFEGLAIEKLWKEKKSYSVVHLDFSCIKPRDSVYDFLSSMEDYLYFKFKEIGFERKEVGGVTAQIENFMREMPNNEVVILIDEYDAPLTACLDNLELFNAVRKAMSNFYSIIKTCDSKIHFLFMTGITKFNKASIFSELNNLSDISLDPTFGSLVGYTHSEVKQYFRQHVEYAANLRNESAEKLLSTLTEYYDGFCFEETATQKLFSPWSLLNFLAYPHRGLKDYWFESGGRPSALLGYMKSHYLRNPEEYGAVKTLSLSILEGASDVDTLSDIGLLTQTGYLTIKRVDEDGTVFVDYPNLEVRKAMGRLYLGQLLDGRTAGQVEAGGINRILASGSAEEVFHTLNRLFQSIDYQKYPVKDEATLRAFVQVYMAGAGLKPKVETHNYRGRSDLEVRAGNLLWVFELKVQRDSQSKEEKLKEAAEQMERNKYGLGEDGEKLKRVALVFSVEKRQFVAWKELA